MSGVTRLEPRFVDAIPERLAPGNLYVSMKYATVVHSCCCGCGEEVVTPLTPTDWRMTFDGENVSMWPSVGSWTLPCRSHYVIEGGEVRWAKPWTQEQIDRERRRDRAAKRKHYAGSRLEGPAREAEEALPPPEPAESRQVPSRLRAWISRLLGNI